MNRITYMRQDLGCCDLRRAYDTSGFREAGAADSATTAAPSGAKTSAVLGVLLLASIAGLMVIYSKPAR